MSIDIVDIFMKIPTIMNKMRRKSLIFKFVTSRDIRKIQLWMFIFFSYGIIIQPSWPLLTFSITKISWFIHINPNSIKLYLFIEMMMHFCPKFTSKRMKKIWEIRISRPYISLKSMASIGRIKEDIHFSSSLVSYIGILMFNTYSYIKQGNIPYSKRFDFFEIRFSEFVWVNWKYLSVFHII